MDKVVDDMMNSKHCRNFARKLNSIPGVNKLHLIEPSGHSDDNEKSNENNENQNSNSVASDDIEISEIDFDNAGDTYVDGEDVK